MEKKSRAKRPKGQVKKSAKRASAATRGAGRQFLGHHAGYLFKDYFSARSFAFRAHKLMKKGAKVPTIRKVESVKATFDHVVQVPFKDVDPEKLADLTKAASHKAKKK